MCEQITWWSTFTIVRSGVVTVDVNPFWRSFSGYTVLFVKRISTVSVWLPRLPVCPRWDETVCSPENRLDFRVSDSQEEAEIVLNVPNPKSACLYSLFNKKLAQTVVLFPIVDTNFPQEMTTLNLCHSFENVKLTEKNWMPRGPPIVPVTVVRKAYWSSVSMEFRLSSSSCESIVSNFCPSASQLDLAVSNTAAE